MGGLTGLVERAGLVGQAQEAGWASLLSLLFFSIYKKNRKEKEEKEKVGVESGHGDKFFRTRKNMLVPRKIERGMIERFKFKHI